MTLGWAGLNAMLAIFSRRWMSCCGSCSEYSLQQAAALRWVMRGQRSLCYAGSIRRTAGHAPRPIRQPAFGDVVDVKVVRGARDHERRGRRVEGDRRVLRREPRQLGVELRGMQHPRTVAQAPCQAGAFPGG